MVTNYTPNNCKYAYDRLDNVVFLVSKDAIGSISIDNGAAYVASASSAMSIACSNLSLSEDESLDERYQFNHKLQFTVQGYMNVDDFEGKYYVILKDVNNTYWLMNPMFPCKVTYTYTIGAEENHTDFTFSTISNFPLLKVNDFTTNYTKPCNGYNLCGIDILALNERNYSKIEGDTVTYSNDGFKDVVFLKNSCIFTEQFDGTIVSHQVKFNISFDDYKSSWHYNLLEFADNKYAMVLQTKCGTNIACGFSHGLNPSFVVTANENEFNSIEITLSDLHDEGTFIKLPTHVPYNYTSATTWVWVEGEYECINDTTAKRLLMEECDAFGNRLDRYKYLDGYRVEYEYLADKLVGSFTEIVTFPCDACRNTSCSIGTSMPSEMRFTASGQSKSFTLSATSDFTVESSSQDIVVTPTSGAANTPYTLTVTSNAVPTSAAVEYSVTIAACENSYQYVSNVIVQSQSPSYCLPQGQNYNIGYEAQEVIIPTSCCVMEVSANTVNLKNFQIQDGYVRMWADGNDTGSGRTMTVLLTMCDETESVAYVTQGSFYSEWRTERTECNGRQMCDFQRLYSGLTQATVSARTYITRWNNCVDSEACKAQNYKWVESNDTVCENGKMWYLEYLNIYENGSWRKTGQVRYGRQAEDVSGKCATHIEHWILDNGYYCDDTIKYKKERLYYEEHYGDPESAWTQTDIYRMGEVEEMNSLDCGYGSDSGYTYQQWRPDGYICLGGSKYTTEKKYVSNDTTNWVATDIYRTGVLVDQFSEECGWASNYEYRWVIYDEMRCGSGDSQYNLYQMYGQERRPIDSVSEFDWEPVVPTVLSYDADGTEDPILIESGSSQCGSHAPTIEPQYRWVELPNTNVDYYCSGTTKYFMEKRQISIDNGETWSDMSPVEYRMGDVVEYDSVACGGGSGNVPQYRWVTITPSSDPSSYICDDCLEPRYRTISGTPYCTGVDKYQDVYDQVSYDSGNTWQTTATTSVLIEAQSTDCGYVPPFDGKFKATYTGGTTYSAACDSDRILDWGETRPNEYQTSTIKHVYMAEAIIGDCVTKIDNQAFQECPSLTSVTIPNSVTSIGHSAFTDCISLTSITVPSSVTYNGDAVFSGCSSLVTVTMPNLTAKDRIFANCSHLTSIITGPNGVAGYGDYGIPEYAFYSCRSLTSITLANDVRNIGKNAFNSCRSLTSITIPSTVRNIYYGAFAGCISLQSITCLPTTPPILEFQVFNNTNNCPIYVPAASVNTYKSTYPWSHLSDRIQAIP